MSRLGNAWRAFRGVTPTVPATIEQRQSQAGFVAFVNAGPWLQNTPRNYEIFAKEGYQANFVVYRAIREVARAVASIPWQLFDTTDADQPREITNHPLIEIMEQPNHSQSGQQFMDATVAYYMISGNSYWELAESRRINGRPAELYALRPDRMEVRPGPFSMPSQYVYRAGGSETRWEVDPRTGDSPIRHTKMFHPINDWYGMSPLEACGFSADQVTALMKWSLAVLRNEGRPSGAITYTPAEGMSGELPESVFNRLQTMIKERFSGADNAGRPMLLEGGLKWQQMALSPKEMDFLNLRADAAREVSSALGVPPMLAGIVGDNTYANYSEARLALWQQTVIPLVEIFVAEANAWLVPRYGENVEFRPDLSSIPALVEVEQKRREAIDNASYMTINEKREAVGLSRLEGGDTLYIPLNLVPLGTPVDDGSDESEEDETRAKIRLIETR